MGPPQGGLRQCARLSGSGELDRMAGAAAQTQELQKYQQQLAKVQRERDNAVAARKEAESEAQSIMKDYSDKMKGLVSKYQTTATYAVGGAVLGGGAAYLFHDDVVDFFGKDSWLGYLSLPAIGALCIYATTKIKDGNKVGSKLDDRMGLLGLGLGLLLGGGYMSYQTWPSS